VTQQLTGILGPAFMTVFVNGVLYNQQPMIQDGQLVECYGTHDMFYLRIEYPGGAVMGTVSSLSIWPDSTPVKIQWGRSPDLNFWYGYVNHHEINSAADSSASTLQLTYICIGTSAILNSAVTRKWEQVSPTYMATQIASENGFRAVTSPTGVVLQYEVQAGESDFQFLNRIADKTGMRFWASSGTLYMISPIVAISGSGSSAIPVFTQNLAMNVLDTCRNFKYLKGKNVPGSVQANRALYGIDKASGQLFVATTLPTNNTSNVAIKTTYATQAYADAEARVDAWASLSQFWITATAQLYGTTELYPGKLVHVTGGALPDSAAGYWLVSQVTHSIVQSGTGVTNLDVYLTDVVLLRNTAESNSVVLANTQPVTPEFTQMTLNAAGHWISSNLAVVSIT
jgi:phage protein D